MFLWELTPVYVNFYKRRKDRMNNLRFGTYLGQRHFVTESHQVLVIQGREDIDINILGKEYF